MQLDMAIDSNPMLESVVQSVVFGILGLRYVSLFSVSNVSWKKLRESYWLITHSTLFFLSRQLKSDLVAWLYSKERWLK